jgi:hypothetical protein
MCAKISDSIDDNIIKKVIDLLPDQFYTKDVSSHPLMIQGHPDLIGHSHYHAFIGKFLKNDLCDERRNLLLKELASGGSRGSLWLKKYASVKSDGPATEKPISKNTDIPEKNSVRKEHFDTLDFMITPRFREIKEIFESYCEIGGVYFRPIAQKVTVVDLHPLSPKPRIGVGDDPYVYYTSTPSQIRNSMGERIHYLVSKRRLK